MKTLTVDDYQRVRLPDVTPRSKFAYQKNADGTITLTELKPELKKPRLVRPVRHQGLLVLPTGGVEVDTEALDREIRQEREQANAQLLG